MLSMVRRRYTRLTGRCSGGPSACWSEGSALLLALLLSASIWLPAAFAQDGAVAPAPPTVAQDQGSWRPIPNVPADEVSNPEVKRSGEASGAESATPSAAAPSAAPVGTVSTPVAAPNDTAPAEAAVPAEAGAESGVASEAAAPVEATPAAAQGAEAVAPKVAESTGQVLPENPHALPGELSPWSMFLAADIVVKAVMVGLALASFLVWTIWIAKTVQLALGRRRFTSDLDAIAARPNLSEALATVSRRKSLASVMLEIALREKQASGGTFRPSSLARIHSRLSEIETRVGRDIRGGMSFLATVAATAPFIGLFGTVWGIMNSFIGISKSQTTNLAVVAPGIAEALLATAIGLVAAIPAVILYNNLGKGVGSYRRLARETRGEVERIASREVDEPTEFRRYPGLAAAAE